MENQQITMTIVQNVAIPSIFKRFQVRMSAIKR